MESVARTVTNTHSHLTWLLSAVRLTPAKAMPFQCMACSTVLVQKQCQLFIALCYTTKQEQEHEQHTPWQPFRNIQCEWYFAVIINRQKSESLCTMWQTLNKFEWKSDAGASSSRNDLWSHIGNISVLLHCRIPRINVRSEFFFSSKKTASDDDEDI